MKSMTGYGRGESLDSEYKVVIEIKSVNHRYNDIIVKMPNYLSSIDEKIKRIVREKISRGKVDVFINLEKEKNDDIDIVPDLELAKSYLESIEKLSNELGVTVDRKIIFDRILRYPNVLNVEKKEEDEGMLFEKIKVALKIALDDLIKMRVKEGEKLYEDILLKIDIIVNLIENIEKNSESIVTDYKERLEKRLESLLDDKYDIDELRLANEVVYFADKVGIDEELVRLRSHIMQIEEVMSSKDVVGRKLDFIVQEINREVNTIGSKVGDVEITKDVVEIKSEVEKIREQIQNIE